jgi:hypothetical protein
LYISCSAGGGAPRAGFTRQRRRRDRPRLVTQGRVCAERSENVKISRFGTWGDETRYPNNPHNPNNPNNPPASSGSPARPARRLSRPPPPATTGPTSPTWAGCSSPRVCARARCPPRYCPILRTKRDYPDLPGRTAGSASCLSIRAFALFARFAGVGVCVQWR